MMGSADQFLNKLVNYPKENILPPVVAAIQEYLNDTDFDPDSVRSKSSAAAGIGRGFFETP